MSETTCGTYAAYQRHKRRVEEIDDACREANRDYMRFMRRNGRYAERDNAQTAAYRRAVARLRSAHRGEFDAYYAEELGAEAALRGDQ